MDIAHIARLTDAETNAALLPSLPHTACMEAHTLTSSNLGEIWREIEKERYIYRERERERAV